MKFNGKQTGSHKANNAQRLTEVNILIHTSSNLCLLFQLFRCVLLQPPLGMRRWLVLLPKGSSPTMTGRSPTRLWSIEPIEKHDWTNRKTSQLWKLFLLAFRCGYMDWKLIDDVINIKCWNIILSVQLVSFHSVFCFSTRWLPNYANRAKKTNYSKVYIVYTMCLLGRFIKKTFSEFQLMGWFFLVAWIMANNF